MEVKCDNKAIGCCGNAQEGASDSRKAKTSKDMKMVTREHFIVSN